jgi:5-methylcytosine-specific restriction endonuclease McrA
MWDSSYPSIVADIAVCQGERDPYYKKVPQWIAQNQRSARLGADGQITEQDWLEVLEMYGNVCASCGTSDDIAIDHIIPLSRGGSNTKENIRPLCRACNVSKSNKMPDEWNGRKGGRPRKQSLI